MDVESAAEPPYARIDTRAEIPAALAALGARCERPVLVSVGGAGGMGEADRERIHRLVEDHLVPLLDRVDAAVVDGGTDAGIMRILGLARAARRARFALVGVAAAGTVRLPGSDPDSAGAPLEPRHTGVVVVPGDAWGQESPWISAVAARLAGARPSVTLVVNGGEITYSDVENSLAVGRPVLALQGSGRTADTIASAAAGGVGGARGAGGAGRDVRAVRIARSALIGVVPLGDPEAVVAAVESVLTGAPPPP